MPNWSSTSCDLGVFVYQPAEQIATSEMKVGMAMSQVTAVDELFGTYMISAFLDCALEAKQSEPSYELSEDQIQQSYRYGRQ